MPRAPNPYARPSKPLRLPGPAADPHADKQNTDSFKEAERLAHEHGLGYLSISGVFKLSRIIAFVRGECQKQRA